MRTQLRPAVVLLILLTLLTGVLYPAMVTVVAKICFPQQAEGSILVRNGQLVGSALIGQAFSDPKYFWPRPSATSPLPYSAQSSSGSNLGPSNAALVDGVKQRIAALKSADPDNTQSIPIDLVTSSGSGLDPHISMAAAEYQVGRVARARQMSVDSVKLLIIRASEDRDSSYFGDARVNVLKLNLALDGQ